MIGTLTSLRFFFAIMIFMHHFQGNGVVGLFDAGGTCGVSFFMILSGFVISVGYFDKVQLASFNYTSFIVKRLIRIYPLHLLCLLGFIVLSISTFSMLGLLKLIPNAFLLQSWIPDRDYYFSGNAVSWCLSDMLFFYLSFPFLVKGIVKYSRFVLVFLSGAILFAYFLFIYFLPEGDAHRFLYISPLFRLLDFILGISIYRLYCRTAESKWKVKLRNCSFLHRTLIECTIVLVLTIILIAFPIIPEKLQLACYYWPIMALLIFYFAVIGNSGGAICYLLKNKWLQRLGNISFTFYMIHYMGITVLNACLRKLQIEISWNITFPLFFVLILIISFIVYNYFENPMASYLKRKLK